MAYQSMVDMRAPRREALNAAKAAVHAYARDPSKANAIAVDVAWRRVRALDSVMPWRNERAATDPKIGQHPAQA
jgi:hypothetical protein